MNDDSYTSQGSSWRYRAAIGLVAVVVLLAIAARRGKGPGGAGPDQPAGPKADDEAAELERQLSAVLDGLRPERLGVSVDAEGLVDGMNLWWADYSQLEEVDIPALEMDSVRAAYGEAAFKYASGRRFDTRDMAHVRNCQMYRAIAEYIAETSEDDVGRALTAYRWVVDNVELSPGSSAGPPVTPFEVLLLGRGRPEDRAWLLAEILRQLGTDCVLISPADDESADDTSAGLVGVIGSAGDVYLFDVKLGLAIPSAAATPDAWQIDRPATLSEVRADPSLLRQLDVEDGEAYPLTNEQLTDVRVQFVSQSEFSATRMAGLQEALPAQYAMSLVDPLTVAEEGTPGLLDRVRMAGSEGRWSEDVVEAWLYPEQRTTAFHEAGAEDAEELSQTMRRMAGPRVKRTELVDDTRRFVDVIGNSDRPLRYVRVQQMRGELSEALVGYGQIRSAASFVTEAVNDETKEYSVYWIAVCQRDLGRYESCLGTLRVYLKDYPSGVWSRAAQRLQAVCEAELGRFHEAAEILESASEGRTPSPRNAILIQRWRAMAGDVPEPTP